MSLWVQCAGCGKRYPRNQTAIIPEPYRCPECKPGPGDLSQRKLGERGPWGVSRTPVA